MLTSYSPMINASDPFCALIFYYRSLVQLFDEAYIHREWEYCTDLWAKEGNNSGDIFVMYYNPLVFCTGF